MKSKSSTTKPDADLAACVLGGAGKARRFSRTKIKALADARRASRG